MSRRILRRLLTEAATGANIIIQKSPGIGYMITSEDGAETVIKNEEDLIDTLEGFKEAGVMTVDDALTGEIMSIDQYMDMYASFLDDFNSYEKASPLSPDNVMSDPDYIPEPDSATNFSSDFEEDVDIFDFEDEDTDDYI